MSYIIGLTGPTGAGKGVFSSCAKSLEFTVIDCDLCAREAVKKGMPALNKLTAVFGNDILLSDGELDRKKLAQKAFSSRRQTELLNKTVLPFISEIVADKIKGEFVLLDAPTLFESGINEICNTTVAVLSPEKIRLARIKQRDNIDDAAANLRMGAGKPDKFYKQNANRIFINDGDIDSFKKTVTIYLKSIIGGAHNE